MSTPFKIFQENKTILSISERKGKWSDKTIRDWRDKVRRRPQFSCARSLWRSKMRELLLTDTGRYSSLNLSGAGSQGITEINFSLAFWSLKHFILLKIAEHPKKLLFLYTVSLDIYYIKSKKKCWSLKTTQADIPSAMRLRSSLQVSCSFGKILLCDHEEMGREKGQWCVSTVIMGDLVIFLKGSQLLLGVSK